MNATKLALLCACLLVPALDVRAEGGFHCAAGGCAGKVMHRLHGVPTDICGKPSVFVRPSVQLWFGQPCKPTYGCERVNEVCNAYAGTAPASGTAGCAGGNCAHAGHAAHPGLGANAGHGRKGSGVDPRECNPFKQAKGTEQCVLPVSHERPLVEKIGNACPPSEAKAYRLVTGGCCGSIIKDPDYTGKLPEAKDIKNPKRIENGYVYANRYQGQTVPIIQKDGKIDEKILPVMPISYKK